MKIKKNYCISNWVPLICHFNGMPPIPSSKWCWLVRKEIFYGWIKSSPRKSHVTLNAQYFKNVNVTHFPGIQSHCLLPMPHANCLSLIIGLCIHFDRCALIRTLWNVPHFPVNGISMQILLVAKDFNRMNYYVLLALVVSVLSVQCLAASYNKLLWWTKFA